MPTATVEDNMENLSLHIKNFNNRVKVMNQTNAKELTLSALDARNLHNDIFDLLAKINDLTISKGNADADISVEFDGGDF